MIAILRGVCADIIFGATIVGTPFVGMVAGWIIGFIFPHTFSAFLAGLGLDMAPWQFGLMLGFVGAFFNRPKVSYDVD